MTEPADMVMGQIITFRSKNANDNVRWKGKVDGFVSYKVAKGYGDILSYHTAIKKTDPTIGDIESLHYFILELADNTDGGAPVRVYAWEWVETGSMVIIDEASVVVLKIYDILGTDLTDVVEALNAKGYYVEVA